MGERVENPKARDLGLCSEMEEALRFYDLLKRAWSKETSYDPAGWTPNNRAYGQCAITALAVQDRFGGKILKVSLEKIPGFEKMRSHYFNRLADGSKPDFTYSQFPDWVINLFQKEEEAGRDVLLSNEDIRRRYQLLKQILEKLEKETPIINPS